MNFSLVSERYAAALFALAIAKNLVQEVFTDSGFILETCRNSHDLRLFLKSPIINTGKKLTIIRSLFGHHLNNLTLRYLEIMVRKRREKFVMGVATEFLEIYKEYRNILTVVYRSPMPPGEETRQQVIALMKHYTKAEIDLQPVSDDSLIGGFVLRWHDKQYDASLLRELENIRNKVAKVNLYKREL